MARFMGLPLDLKSVKVTPLIDANSKDWRKAILEANEGVATAIANAEKEGKVLTYVANITISAPGVCEAVIGLEAHPEKSIIGQLTAADACCIIHTERLNHPMVVQGPAAAVEVTAKAVFSDLLRLSRELGARDGGLQVIPESPFVDKVGILYIFFVSKPY
jgi:homoserine dehydrogenase